MKFIATNGYYHSCFIIVTIPRTAFLIAHLPICLSIYPSMQLDTLLNVSTVLTSTLYILIVTAATAISDKPRKNYIDIPPYYITLFISFAIE